MSRRIRASSLGPEARLGRSRSPVRLGTSFSSRNSSTRGAIQPGEEKETMRSLNGRLADYLNQVRLLEDANGRLETQIKQVLTQRRATGQRDWSSYDNTLSTIRDQMKEMTMNNARLMLQIDNARLTADDFKVKFEAEIAIRQGVERDITSLRKMIDDTQLSHLQLESEVEALTEELIYLKKNHEEDLAAVKVQIQDASVDVQMDSAKGQDLGETIDRIRQQYEKAAQKNREETEAWYQAKFETVSAEVNRNTDALQQGQSELNDLRRQKQGLEIDLQTMHSMNHSLEDTLNDTLGRYSRTVNSHNTVIQQLEAELAEVLAQVTRQGSEYQALLNIKSKLEEEIATYHSLLEGTGLPSHGAPGSGLPDNHDFRGMGARDDVNIKNIGLPEDIYSNRNGEIEDINIGGNSFGGNDESVEFSLEQALNAVPCSLVPDPPLCNEIEEEEMISQKDLELNAANNAMNKKYDQNGSCQEIEEDPLILEEMTPLRVENEYEEETMNSEEECQVERKEEVETLSPGENTVAETEMVRHLEDNQVEKENTLSPVEYVQVEEEVNCVADIHVEETVSPVVKSQVENIEEETVSHVVRRQVENLEKTVSPVVEDQVEEVKEETASPVVEDQVEDETASPVVEDQVEEEIESPVVEYQVEEMKEETVSPVVEDHVELKEETESPVVENQVELMKEETESPGVEHQVEEVVVSTVSPVVEDQVEETEETVSPVAEDQVEEVKKETVISVVENQLEKVQETVSSVVEDQLEETVNPPEHAQAEEVEEIKPSVENFNADEETQEREEPVNPEAEPLLSME